MFDFNGYLDFYKKNKSWFLWIFFVGIPLNILLHVFGVPFWADFTDFVIFVLAILGLVFEIASNNKGN